MNARAATKISRTLLAHGINSRAESLAGGFYGAVAILDGYEIVVGLTDDASPVFVASLDDEDGTLGTGDSVELGRGFPLRELPARLLANLPTILDAPRI